MKAVRFVLVAAVLLAAPIHAQPPEGGERPPGCEPVPPLSKALQNARDTFKMEYPAASLRAGEQGEVVVSMCVSAEGETSNLRIVRSSGYPRLDQASLQTFENALMMPAKDRCGHPVAFCDPPYEATIVWRLPR